MNKLWFEYDHYDSAIVNNLSGLFGELKNYHDDLVTTTEWLKFLYWRDSYRTAGKYNLPEWLLQKYNSWVDSNYAAPTRNIIKSNTDFIHSLLCTDLPNIKVFSSNAGYEEQLVARSREAALDGTMNTPAFKKVLQNIGRTGMSGKIGLGMPTLRNGTIVAEQLSLDQVYWDYEDSRHGNPTQIHVVTWPDKRQFLNWYKTLDKLDIPDFSKKIEKIKEMRPVAKTRESSVETVYDWTGYTKSVTSASNRLRLVRSWLTASSPTEEDGREIWTLYGEDNNQGLVILDDVFKRSTLPVVWFCPFPPEEGCGIVGGGIADQLVEKQRAIDFSMSRIQNRIEKMGWTKVGIPTTMTEEAIENYVAEEITVVRLPGADKPIELGHNPLSQHDLLWVSSCVNDAASDLGLNEPLARGASNRGANASGLAMYEEYDRQIDRLSSINNSWRYFVLRFAEESLNCIEDAIRIDEKFATNYKDADGDFIRFEWADKSLQNAQFTLHLEEVSEYGHKRSSRIAKIMEQVKLGMLPASTGSAALQDSPDIRGLNRMANSARRLVEKDINKIITGKMPGVPNRDYDLPLTVELVGQAIRDAMASEAKVETLLALTEYKRQAEAALESMLAEQQQAQVAQAAAAQAAQGITDQATDQQASQLAAEQGITI